MLVKVPYIDKNDNYFYDIIKNETKMDSFFCYQIRPNLVYVNKKDRFDIKMPKVIKKLSDSVPEDNFIVLELILDTIYVYVNNREKDFEYYEYSNNEKPLIQLFVSTLTGDDKFTIYYIENEELKQTINRVVNETFEHIKINAEEDIVNVDVSITPADIDLFFTKISLEDKIKNKIKEIKNKFIKNISNKKIPKVSRGKSDSKKVFLGIFVFLGLIAYYLYDNGYYEKFIGIVDPVIVKEEIIVAPIVPQIDYKLITLTKNYKTFKYIEDKLINSKVDLLEVSNDQAIYIAKLEKIENMNNKFFINNNTYIVNDVIKNIKLDREDFEIEKNINIEDFIEFRTSNQMILKLKEDNLIKVIKILFYNDTVDYNLNLYRINDIYQVVVYSNNVIEDLNGKVSKAKTIVLDTGSFEK